MRVLHCIDGFKPFDFENNSLPSCPFLVCGEDIYLITRGICCKDVLPDIDGSGVIRNGEIVQWYFEEFPEISDEKIRDDIFCAILGIKSS